MPKVMRSIPPKPATIMSVRVENDIKQRFEAFCDDVGINPSIAFNMFIRAALRENRLPFDVIGSREKDPFYSDENMARLRASIHQLKTTGGKVHDLSQFEKDLEND